MYHQKQEFTILQKTQSKIANIRWYKNTLKKLLLSFEWFKQRMLHQFLFNKHQSTGTSYWYKHTECKHDIK